MRNCSRHLHIKILKRGGYSNEEYTPLLFKPWFILLLLALWIILIISNIKVYYV